ncbi:MAG: hypothetical protein IPP32_12325 [Bacteroidetes bacterium]|nr:hypothetical protein [Bacteroidota bacterium]
MEEKTEPKNGFRILSATMAIAIAFIALVAFLFITFFFFHSEIIPYKFFEQATGNYAQLIAGVIGTLLSFAGIILIYATFKEQQDSNKAQDDKQNRQTKLFNQQQFETTFFNLIENHFRIIKSFDEEFFDLNRNSSKDKSGYNQLNDCFRRFRIKFYKVADYQISSQYSNYQTINFYPLADENIDKAIIIKSASNIQLILDYILSSKQIDKDAKELYARILFTSLNESEVYFYIARSFWETGKSNFFFKNFNDYFLEQEMMRSVKFSLNQSLGFYTSERNGPSREFVLTANDVKSDLKLIEMGENQEINSIEHSIYGENVSFEFEEIVLLFPERKKLKIDFDKCNGGGMFYIKLPIASIANELYPNRFVPNSVEEKKTFFDEHQLAISYSIKTGTESTKIWYKVKMQYEALNQIRMEIE